MNTFTSTVSNRTIQIERSFNGGICFLTSNMNSREFIVDKKHAPALALAILEAAGWPEDDPNSATRTIMQDLRCVIAFDERKAKEAADREALEHEAEALYLAGCEFLATTAAGHTTVAWDDLSGRTQEAHLSVARKARELHKAVS